MTLEEHKNLTGHTTFGVPAEARYFAELHTPSDLEAVLATIPAMEKPPLVLGGGSNILFVDAWPGLVLHPRFARLTVLDETPDSVLVQVEAGYHWETFVRQALARKWYGVENLTLIPGSVGAAPVQNIGAYGVELKDVFISLEAIDLRDGTARVFHPADCRFGYRTSRFKQEPYFFITSVTFLLSRRPEPRVTYPALQAALEEQRQTDPTPEQVYRVVQAIRRSKLPDPDHMGNAGSFFRNPMVPRDQADRLRSQYPDLPVYPHDEATVKIPAAWLVEQCGWKGMRRNRCGVYEKHALILVNYGGATGAEIWSLATDIRQSVGDRFGIELEPEPIIIRGNQ